MSTAGEFRDHLSNFSEFYAGLGNLDYFNILIYSNCSKSEHNKLNAIVVSTILSVNHFDSI